MMLPSLSAEDWPQWLGPNRDGVWNETGIIDNFPPNGPKVVWRAPIAGGYAGPAVANGKVYVSDYLTKADVTKETFERTDSKGQERVQCFSADKGELLWHHEYDCKYTISYPAGPRATPTVADGKVYTLGAEGNFLCLDAAKGAVLWSKDFKRIIRPRHRCGAFAVIRWWTARRWSASSAAKTPVSSRSTKTPAKNCGNL